MVDHLKGTDPSVAALAARETASARNALDQYVRVALEWFDSHLAPSPKR